jgi:hypothetical protein
MTAPNTVLPGGSVWAVATRFTPLDALGNLIPGSGSFVTDTLIKATMTPVYEAGDAVAIKNAAGELSVYAIHGDIPKWYTASIDLALPDPYLEQLLTGGVVFNDVSAALGVPSAPTVTARTTGGSLAAGTYAYAESNFNNYGESLNSTQVTQVTTGSTSENVIVPTFTAGSFGSVIYGRIVGVLQRLGIVANIGAQATSAASGTGTVTTLTLTATTKPIPANLKFTITGDTNTPAIIFTSASAVPFGTTVMSVTAPTVTTTIAPGVLIPVFVDDGTVSPAGLPNSVDLTAGPGNNVGYQTAAMGHTSNPNGVAVEMWQKRIINGTQATDYPYWWHVWPMVKNLHVMPRDFTNANLANTFDGEAFQNANFGSGPTGQWPFDSTKVFQRAVCGADVVPVPSVGPVAAEY